MGRDGQGVLKEEEPLNVDQSREARGVLYLFRPTREWVDPLDPVAN